MLKATVIKQEVIKETLARNPTKGKQTLDPFTALAKEAGANIALLEICQDESRAEVHRATIDFFYCLEGEVEFVTDGVLIDPFIRKYEDGSTDENEIRAKIMEGGTTQKLTSGDMIWIPNGLTHFNRSSSSGRLLVLKIPAKEVFPLEEVKGWVK